jgi:putative methionine-R-sulfoxide reductase with GAF domain
MSEPTPSLAALEAAVTSRGATAARAQRAAELIRAASGRRWVGIYRVGAGHVTNLAWSGVGPPAYPVFRSDRGLTGAALRMSETVLSNDVARDPRYLTNQSSSGAELIVPIQLGGVVVGTLDVEDPQPGAFTDADQAYFEAVAGMLPPLFSFSP